MLGYVPLEVDASVACFPLCVQYAANVSEPYFCPVVNVGSTLQCMCGGYNTSVTMITKGLVCEPETDSIFLLALQFYCLIFLAVIVTSMRNLGCSGKISRMRKLHVTFACVTVICLVRIAQLVPRVDSQYVYPDEVKAVFYVFPQLLQLPIVYFTIAQRTQLLLTKPFSLLFLLNSFSLLFVGGCIVCIWMFLSEGSKSWKSLGMHIGVGSIQVFFLLFFFSVMCIEHSYFLHKKRNKHSDISDMSNGRNNGKSVVVCMLLFFFLLQTVCLFMGFLEDEYLFVTTVVLYIVDCLFCVCVLYYYFPDTITYKNNVKKSLHERQQNKRLEYEKKWKINAFSLLSLSPPSPSSASRPQGKKEKTPVLSVQEWYERYVSEIDEEKELFSGEDIRRFSLDALVVLMPLIATDSLHNKEVGCILRHRIDNEQTVNEIVNRFLYLSSFEKWMETPRGNICHPFFPSHTIFRRKCIHTFHSKKKKKNTSSTSSSSASSSSSLLMCVCCVSEAPCTLFTHTCKKTPCFVFKKNIDVYNDIVCLLLQQLMNSMWKKEKNSVFTHVQTHVYKCLRLSSVYGCVEYVKGARPLCVLFKEENKEILLSQQIKQSAAACFVSSYILGVTNRNDNNIMVNRDGNVFTVDFGSILGDLCSLDNTPFPFTPAFVQKLKKSSGNRGGGGGEEKEWEEFEEACEWAYSVLRQPANREKIIRLTQTLFPEYCHPFINSFLATRLQRDVANDYARMGFRNMLRITLHARVAHFAQKCQITCCRKDAKEPVGALFWEVTDGYLQESEMKAKPTEKSPKKRKDQEKNLLLVPLASSSSSSSSVDLSTLSSPSTTSSSSHDSCSSTSSSSSSSDFPMSSAALSTPGRRSTAFPPPPPEENVIELLAVRDHKDYLMMEDFAERRRASSALPPPPSPDRNIRQGDL